MDSYNCLFFKNIFFATVKDELDKKTVNKVVSDLENRFAIKNVIFVGDRGLLTSSNIASVKSHGYNYIMGMQKRNRRIIKYLIEKIPLTAKELQSEQLIIKEVQLHIISMTESK